MPHHHKLSAEERSVLAALKREGLSQRAIADRMDRSVSTISDELKRNGAAAGYDPHAAHLQTKLRRWEANRSNPAKPKRFDAFVEEKLKEGWSPEIIAGRMRKDFPSDPVMHAVHETIYQRAYRLGLAQLLPRRKPRRERRRYRLQKARGNQGLGHVQGIEHRPEEANARTRCGHWEGDTMLGRRASGPAVSVQTDRLSRYLLLTKMRRKTASAMRRAVRVRLQSFPRALRRTLTLDRGTENAQWQSFGLPVFFCDPYSSWQKGSVEQVIGLVRRYIPKGTDLRLVTPKQLRAIQDRLNNRPRKVLGFQTPAEVFSSHCKSLGVRI
jgi:IS30 family transposase